MRRPQAMLVKARWTEADISRQQLVGDDGLTALSKSAPRHIIRS